jgi:hypothetical protein
MVLRGFFARNVDSTLRRYNGPWNLVGRTEMERSEFVAEGRMEVGPAEHYFTFLDGEYVGRLLLRHFGLPEERNYSDLGRVRVTVERLEEPRT